MQTQAVRLLIAQHRLEKFRIAVDESPEPLLVADADGRILFPSPALAGILPAGRRHPANFDELAALFDDQAAVRDVLSSLREGRVAWRGEWRMSAGGGVALGVRADVVPGPDETVLGFILMFTDLTDAKRTEAARRHLEQSLTMTGQADAQLTTRETRGLPDEVMGAILANASVAAMELTDTTASIPVATLIEELEASATRAAAVYARLREFNRPL
jgi:PAS domain S-box-containing protein